jgi:hypothetical protein
MRNRSTARLDDAVKHSPGFGFSGHCLNPMHNRDTIGNYHAIVRP